MKSQRHGNGFVQQGDAFDEENFFKVERVDGSVYEGPLDKDNEPHGKGV